MSGRVVGVVQRERFPDDTSRQGRGPSRPPSPSAPPPRGDSPSIHCPGSDLLLTRFQARNSPKIVSRSLALYPGQSPRTARPLWRGREEAAERPGGGGGRRIPFNQRHRRQRRGLFHPPPRRAPPPRGRFPIDTVSGESITSAGFRRETPRRSSLLPRSRPSGQSPHTARPLWRGREEAAERPGGGGVSTSHGKRVSG